LARLCSYQFIGGPTFDALFANYMTNPAFHELPGDMSHSELVFFGKFPVRIGVALIRCRLVTRTEM
jgi:hypothetical protein